MGNTKLTNDYIDDYMEIQRKYNLYRDNIGNNVCRWASRNLQRWQHLESWEIHGDSVVINYSYSSCYNNVDYEKEYAYKEIPINVFLKQC